MEGGAKRRETLKRRGVAHRSIDQKQAAVECFTALLLLCSLHQSTGQQAVALLYFIICEGASARA